MNEADVRLLRQLLLTAAVVCGIAVAAANELWPSLAAWQQPSSSGPSNPIAPSAASIKAGAAIYVQACAPCHGTRGRGDGPSAPASQHPSDLTSGKPTHGNNDADLFKVIKEGGGGASLMPSWDSQLRDTEIWNTINYIRMLQRARRPKLPARKK
jgi:mono/diheme cytochrome c family protein